MQIKLRIFSILMLLLLFVPVGNRLSAQNTGPAAPEAMSFEPIDATDMVNLLTGDFSYVLPIIDIPGPGGGYQMALSYHGGIAMDQEASWVGLGWSLNPGALNRSVSGIPDDMKDSKIWIETKLKDITFETWTVSAGVGFADGAGSLGVSYSWGDFKSFGGTVGYGPVNMNFDTQGNMGMGVSAGMNGIGTSVGISSRGISASLSFSSPNAKGFSGAYSSMGISMSSDGSAGISAAGQSINLGSSKGVSLSDYTMLSSGFYIPVYFECFYFAFGHRRVTYSYHNYGDRKGFGKLYMKDSYIPESDSKIQNEDCVTDVYESGRSKFVGDYGAKNMYVGVSTDKYSVSGQGISGSLAPLFYEAGLISGNSIEIMEEFWHSPYKHKLDYYTDFEGVYKRLNSRPYFSFMNKYDSNSRANLDITSGLTIEEFSENCDVEQKRRGGANVVEYFTVEEILKPELKVNLNKRGFIEASSMEGIRVLNGDKSYESSIGAFTVFAGDGKKYHYSLPVYQYEEVLRRNTEGGDNYVEKTNRSKYAYTWLLTAITGPDYIDDGNLIIDDNDVGYWVRFNYAKWTDSFIWQFPYNLEVTYDKYDEGDILWGRKQIYYLNSVETKTHEALFIKKLKSDGLSKEKVNLKLSSMEPEKRFSYVAYHCNEKIKSLALDKIILIKKSGSNSVDPKVNNLLNGVDNFVVESKADPRDEGPGPFEPFYPPFMTFYKSYDNTDILDEGDISEKYIKANAIREIDFFHDYSLCLNSPNSIAESQGKLTLTGILLKGKSGEIYQSPYLFDYVKGGTFDSNNKDIWGYLKYRPEMWSLNEITSPVGAKVKIAYEPDTYNKEFFRGELLKYRFERYFTPSKIISENSGIVQVQIREIGFEFENGLELNKIFKVGDTYSISNEFFLVENNPLLKYESSGMFSVENKVRNLKLARIENNCLYFEDNQDFRFENPSSAMRNRLNGTVVKHNRSFIDKSYLKFNNYITGPNINYTGEGGGCRVKQIKLEPDTKTSYCTNYEYFKPGTLISSGVTSYAPVDMGGISYDISSDIVSLQEEFPLPGVIYENVTVTKGDGSKTAYTFNSYSDEMFRVEFYDEDLRNKISVGISEYLETYTDMKLSHKGEKKVFIDNLASVGRLKNKKIVNSNMDVSFEEKYIYKNILDINYGLSQETFFSVLRHDFIDIEGERTHSSTSTKRTNSKIAYPSVLDRVITSNGSLRTETINLAWDKNTGAVLKSKTITPTNDVLISESVPAYTKYPEMGSKIQNPDNKNMLSQQTASYQYKVFGTVEKLIGAGIQTWKDNWFYREPNSVGNYSDKSVNGIWRKWKSFTWKGSLDTDGAYSGFTNYTWGGRDSSNESKGWQKTSEVTRYSAYSTPLEQKDINGNYGATRYDASGLNIIASIGNARWKEFTATGFENIKSVGDNWCAEGEMTFDKYKITPMESASIHATESTGLNAVEGIEAHTGNFYILSVGTRELIDYGVHFPQGRRMRLSAWIHKKSASSASFFAKGFSQQMVGEGNNLKTNKRSFGDWILMTAEMNFPNIPSNTPSYLDGSIGISTASETDRVFVDDFRIHPIDAPMSAYVYDTKTDALTAILDGENIATKYEYDAGGRLMKVEKETPSGFKLVSEHDYHYAKEIVDEAPRISNFTVSPILDNRSGFFYRVNLNYQLSGGKATEYCLSLDNNFTGNNYWYSYQSNVATSIPLGSHTVYFKVRNILGQESNVVSASAVNAFSLNLDKSNIYYRDPIKGTVYFPNNSYLDGGDLSYKIYQNNNLIKTVSPSFTSAGSNTKLMPIDESDGNITTSAQHFEFSSYGLSKGDYQLIVSGGINNEDSRVSDFSIVSPPPPPPTPSCWASYDEYNSRVTVNWSNFPCSAVNIYLNGVKQAYASVSGGSGTSTFRATLSDLNNGDDPRLMRESELEGERLIEEPGGPSLSNTVKVMCTSGSGQASCPVLMDLLPQ